MMSATVIFISLLFITFGKLIIICVHERPETLIHIAYARRARFARVHNIIDFFLLFIDFTKSNLFACLYTLHIAEEKHRLGVSGKLKKGC